MADTFGIIPAQIASEMPALFGLGFNTEDRPTIDDVVGFISDSDGIVTHALRTATGVAPTPIDDNAILAKRYVIESVKAQVMRVLYTGRAPQDVEAAAKPFQDRAKELITRIDALTGDDSIVEEGSGWAGMPSSTTINVPTWFG